MHNDLKVASVTPHYNGGKYIHQCLKGLTNQTYPIDRIVICDDCSTDDSLDIIKKYIESNGTITKDDEYITAGKIKDSEILILKLKENRGHAHARNAALSLCLESHDYIALCDADDFYYEDKVEKSLDVFKKFPNVGIVYADYDTWNENTKTAVREYKEIFDFNRLSNECIISNNSVVSAKVFKQVGPYDEEINSPTDYDMWLRISEVAPIYHIPEALSLYRVDGNNMSISTPKEELVQDMRKVHYKKLQRRGQL